MLNVKPMEITVPARVLLLGLTVVLSSGCGLCANDEVVRIPSPDTKFEAVVFQRDCGATTGFSTQVSVVTRGASLPNEAGNVFIADTDHGKATSASWGGPPVDLKWSSKRALKVATHPEARIFRKESAISVSTGILSTEKVAVEYAFKGP